MRNVLLQLAELTKPNPENDPRRIKARVAAALATGGQTGPVRESLETAYLKRNMNTAMPVRVTDRMRLQAAKKPPVFGPPPPLPSGVAAPLRMSRATFKLAR